MARTKEFNRDFALRKAVDAFGDSGFEGTSIQTLVNRMGIHRASLYDTYGSKEQLFREALTEYECLVHEKYGPILDSSDPAPAVLGRFFARVIKELTDPITGSTSCLMLKTALSGARHLSALPEQVRRYYDWYSEQFERLITRGRNEGTIGSRRSDAELARVLRFVLLGVVAAAAVDGDADGIGVQVERELALLAHD